jgi:hypothetical protein
MYVFQHIVVSNIGDGKSLVTLFPRDGVENGASFTSVITYDWYMCNKPS